MPNLKQPHPVISGRLSRHAKLSQDFPIASRLIQKIRLQLESHKYGDSFDELDTKYQFIDFMTAKNFLEIHLDGRSSTKIDINYLSACLARTLNIKRKSEIKLSTTEIFQLRAKDISNDINQIQSKSSPIVNFVIGGTGSGKTSYSKGLFTAGIFEFYNNYFIPCRIEYSHFFDGVDTFSEEKLVNAIKQCMVRDFFIYARFGASDNEILTRLADALGKFPELRKNIYSFISETEGDALERDDYTLRDAHRQWSDTIGYLGEIKLADAVLSFVRDLDTRFVISLDGFDIVETQDFLIGEYPCLPVDAAVALVTTIAAKAALGEYRFLSMGCHYTIYLRDTTYTRLRIALNSKPGGSYEIEPLWISPPRYAQMSNKVASLVSDSVANLEGDAEDSENDPDENEGEAEENVVDEFASKLEKTLKRSIGSFVDREGRMIPIEAVFSFNARHMKRHVIRSLIWCMDHIMKHDDEFVDRLRRSGVGIDIFWQYVLKNDFFEKLKRYQVIEELFLDETHQLRPHLRSSTSTTENHLNNKRLFEAASSLSDYTETIGFFDCILNYLTKDVICEEEDDCLSALMINVRIVQLIIANEWVDYFQIRDYLFDLGYKIDEVRIKFFIYILLRGEFIRIRDDDEEIHDITDCNFSLSMSGVFLSSRLLFSTTYLGECIMVSMLPRNGIGQELLSRTMQDNKEEWLLSVVVNCIIYVNYLKQIENFEKISYVDGKEYEQVHLHDGVRDAISTEIMAIMDADGPESEYLRIELPRVLNDIRDRHEQFDTIIM